MAFFFQDKSLNKMTHGSYNIRHTLDLETHLGNRKYTSQNAYSYAHHNHTFYVNFYVQLYYM